jgi:cytochrome b involved in lipid metabolism
MATTVTETPQAVPDTAPARAEAEKPTAPAEPKIMTLEEVAQHNKPEDIWIIVKGHVMDMTEFQKEHPGGFKSK